MKGTIPFNGNCRFFQKISISCFNANFQIYASFLKTPNKAKSKNINMTKKWKQW